MSALLTGLASDVSCFTLAFFFFGGVGLDGLAVDFDDDDPPDTPVRCFRLRSVTIINSFSDFFRDKIPWFRHL
jgi:hypothetical protein